VVMDQVCDALRRGQLGPQSAYRFKEIGDIFFKHERHRSLDSPNNEIVRGTDVIDEQLRGYDCRYVSTTQTYLATE
jgi:hypothetical protein